MSRPDISEIVVSEIRSFAKKNNLLATPPIKTPDQTTFEVFGSAWYKYRVVEGYRTSSVVSDEPTDLEDGFISVDVLKVLDHKSEPEEEKVFFLDVNDRTFQGRIGTDIQVGNRSETDRKLLAHLAISLGAIFPDFLKISS